MATAIDEEKRAKRAVAGGFAPAVDVSAPLNLTPPGTMRPDAPAPVATQPAPQFGRTNAGPLLRDPPVVPAAPPAADPQQQALANQSAMYVQGAQAAAAARPAPAPAPVAAGMNPAVGASINAAVATPPVRRQAPYTGVNTMTQRAYAEAEARKTAANPTGSIYGMGRSAEPPAQAPAQPLDAQAEADAKMFGRAWDATKGGFQRAGAAIADIATLPIRGAAGAYDTAVIRPMRAAGINAGFMSPLVNPESNANGQSMTPFYDQIRARDQVAQASADAAVPAAAGAPAATQTATAPRSGTTGGTGDARRAAGDYDRTKVAAPPPDPLNGYEKTSIDGVYRKGNSFSDAAGTQDKAFQNRGAISPQNMQAADALAANYNSNQQALARLQANNAATQPAAAPAPRGFDRAASIRALSDLRSPEAIALRNLRVTADQEARDGARMGRAGRGMGAAGQAYAALLAELTSGTRQGQTAEMQDAGATQRATMQDAGATTRAAMGEVGANQRAQMTNDVQQGELGLKREAQGFQSRALQQLEKASADYNNAKTPEERTKAAQRIQALQGKGDGTPVGKDRYITTGGGQEYDPKAQAVVTRPQQVFDTVTGRPVGAAPSQQPAAPAYAEGQLLKGKDGKTYIVKNGEAVLAK